MSPNPIWRITYAVVAFVVEGSRYSGQRACLLHKWSEFEFRWSLQLLFFKTVWKTRKNEKLALAVLKVWWPNQSTCHCICLCNLIFTIFMQNNVMRIQNFKWNIASIFFLISIFPIHLTVNKNCHLTGFQVRTSVFGNDHLTKCATATSWFILGLVFLKVNVWRKKWFVAVSVAMKLKMMTFCGH